MRSDPDRLRAIPLFSDLSDEDLEKLASWLTIEEVSEGRRLTPEGGPGYQFYVIEEGTAEVRRNEELIGSLGPGDFFGEMALLAGSRRTATVRARGPVQAMVFEPIYFRPFLIENPSVAVTLLEVLAERLNAVQTRLGADRAWI